MKRKSSSKPQASAVVMLSAGMLMASGSSAPPQAPKAAPPGQKSPAAPQGLAPAMPGGQAGVAGRGTAATYLKFAAKYHKEKGGLSVAGMLNGQPVFKTDQGEFFQVEAQTGDLKFHTADSLGYLKMDDWERKTSAKTATFLKWDGIKGQQRVTLLGVDAQGHVLQENNRGEKFYLSPNGDLVFVK